jgi:site-specific DNA recombinase
VLQGFQGLSGQLFLVQPARIFQLLVRRVTVTTKGLVLDLCTDGTAGVMRNLMMPRKTEADA